MVELFSNAPLGRHLGMMLSYDADHRAVVDIEDAPFLHHALGQVHGGVFATLIDTAAWFTAAVHYSTWISTVDFSVRLLLSLIHISEPTRLLVQSRMPSSA